MVCSFFHTATLKFFRFIPDGSLMDLSERFVSDGSLVDLYERNCEGIPNGSVISLQEEPSENCFFASCDKASMISNFGCRKGFYQYEVKIEFYVFFTC